MKTKSNNGGSLERVVKRASIVWQRSDVEDVIKDAESEARRSGRTEYVGAIGFPDGSQIYGEGTLGHTHDKELLTGLGKLFATCEPGKTTRHA